MTSQNKRRTTLLLSCLLALSLWAEPTQIHYLSGTGPEQTVLWQFRCSDGMNAGKWGRIGVPSCWEQQGYGSYTYGRYYTDKSKKASDEYGEYRHRFDVPKAWKNKVLKLVFEGSMTDTHVWLNGQLVGEVHQGGFCQFEYDITNYVLYGQKNLLEVKVFKQSSNASVNAAERKADWWLFGGIYRPVYLRILPSSHIERLALNPKADGKMEAELYLSGTDQSGKLRLRLREAPNRMNGAKPSEQVQERWQTLNADSMQRICVQWNTIHPWDPEHPHLYDLELAWFSSDGQLLHQVEERIGFRTIEFRPRDGLYLNGQKLKVKGTNRHSFDARYGRTTSRELSLLDARLIKEMNMNAVRSHYPPDRHFLEVCDSMGLLYLNELPGWQNAYDNQVAPRLLKEMIVRDVNHPCLFLWSNGNEGGWNESIDTLFAAYDPQKRHVVHPWADFGGLDTHHYPAYQTGPYRLANGHHVFMPTEFMHGLYDRGQGAGLDDFWENYSRSPLFAGGFLWCYVDEAIHRTDQNGCLDSDGRNAPDGIVSADRQKEGSFFTVRQVWSPIQLAPLRITPSFDGRMLVENAFLFTQLGECQMRYAVCQISPFPQSNREVLCQGSVHLPNSMPGERGYAHFALPTNFFEGDLLQLTAIDHLGDTVCTWSFPIHRSDDYFERYLSSEETVGTASFEENEQSITLKSNDVSVRFNKTSALIEQCMYRNRETAFNNGPRPVGMQARVLKTYARRQGDQVQFVAKYQGGIDSIVWTLLPNGLLSMKAVLLNSPNGHGFGASFVDEAGASNLGLTFSFPESAIEAMTWLGRGPYRVWKNRIKGTQFDLHHKAYNNTITGEYGPDSPPIVYPEFKGYHADIYWAHLHSATMPLSFYSRTEGLYLHTLTPREPLHIGKDNTMESFPEGDISFLLEIPAMRSYKTIPMMGPNSQPSNIRIKKGDEGFLMDVTIDLRF